jgi:catechol 2,3-dioxygenase-like lactoylglutathione lyase family enzyme
MRDTIVKLGPIMQLAYVPRDMDTAIEFWTKTMGAGPFFSLPHIAYKAARYRGEPSNVDFSVLLGYWGDVQIELIEQHDDSPSIYKSWLDAGREGLHHVCLVVDDIAHARAVCDQAGAKLEQEIFLEGGEAIYVDTGGGAGTMVEILEPMPGFMDLCGMMRDAAKGWDGTDPVRSLG